MYNRKNRIGDGELKNELISPNIKITGWKDKEKVLEELNKNDIFILTSLWEGLPIALLEAGYMKKLCIVTNVIGNRDVIKNNENGYIFNCTDEIIKKINKINNIEYYKLTKTIKKDIKENYNMQIMINKYKKVYEE